MSIFDVDVGVREVGLVAARHENRGTIVRFDVREGHEGIDLTTMESTVVNPVLAADDAVMSARVRIDALAGSTQAGEVFVDEYGTMEGVEGAFPADEVFYFLQDDILFIYTFLKYLF